MTDFDLDERPLEEQDSHPELREQTLLDWVPLSKMFVDNYGRPLNQRKVNQILRKFDPRALGTILLSFRGNDTYAVLDGHHRKAVAQQAGYTHMAARVYIDLTYEEEATLYNAFATVNQQTAMDRFRARLEAQEPTALAIVAVLRRYHLEVGVNGAGIGRVQAVGALDWITNEFGLEFLASMVMALHDGWGKESRAWITESLRGFAAFWLRYQDHVDPQRLLNVMRVTSPDRVISMSRSLQSGIGKGGSGAKYWGLSLREYYNRGLRKHQLPEWVDRVLTEEDLAARRARIETNPSMRKRRTPEPINNQVVSQ